MTTWRDGTSTARTAAQLEQIIYGDAVAGTVNVEDYGGDFNAALAALPTVGGRASGEILVPSDGGTGGVYNITTTINLSTVGGVTIRGTGGSPGYPRLVWKNSGSSAMITAGTCFGLRLENLLLAYDHASYSGSLVSIDASGGTDASQFVMQDCWLGGISGAVGAAALLKLNHVINSRVVGCIFQDAIMGITRGFGYVTTLTIADCMFARLSTASINNPGDVWRIRDNVFEPDAGGYAIGIDHDLTYWTNGLWCVGNYFGDASAGAGTWVKLRGAGCELSNYSTAPGPGAGAAHYLIESSFGIRIGGFIEGGAIGVKFQSTAFFNRGIVLDGQNAATTPISGAANAFYFDASYQASNPPPSTNNQGMNLGAGALGMSAIASSAAANNSMFRDSADNKLKYKDNAGTVNALY